MKTLPNVTDLRGRGSVGTNPSIRRIMRWLGIAGRCAIAALACACGLDDSASDRGMGGRTTVVDSGGAIVVAAEGVSASDARAIADSITVAIERAWDLSRPGVVERLMSLYPEDGPTVSASDGRIMSSRDSLEASIAAFWNDIGRNMQGPKWTWLQRRIDVLSPTAAVITFVYTIPHLAPSGARHTVGGAWTAVFARQRDGSWRIVHEHLSSNPSQAMASMTADSTRRPPP